jgi:hypothetical protein
MRELTMYFTFLTALSSDSMSHKYKDDRNPLFYDTNHFQSIETTTIEGNF